MSGWFLAEIVSGESITSTYELYLLQPLSRAAIEHIHRLDTWKACKLLASCYLGSSGTEDTPPFLQNVGLLADVGVTGFFSPTTSSSSGKAQLKTGRSSGGT